jgi:succinate dehydrogenase / fumarate reductase flavoprotein subunit
MGGIACNVDGETELEGFFAAGECACVSVHGANRLGGNSLLDTIVFGQRAGMRVGQFVQGRGKPEDSAAASALEKTRERITSLLEGHGEASPAQLRTELGETMTEKVGIFREKAPMEEALAKVQELKERYLNLRLSCHGQRFNLDLARALELKGMLELAHAIVAGALAREESRGSHYRLDFPKRDDEAWLKHTLARYTPQGPSLEYKEVTITRWPPEVRKY